MVAGDSIIVNDSLIDNPIIGVAWYAEDKILRFITKQKHDLTEGYDRNLFNGKIRLTGFSDPALNQDHILISVPNQYTFEIGWLGSITLTGNEILRENVELGINNNWVINSATTNTFDILLTGVRKFEPGVLPQVKSVTNVKIDVVIDEKTARSLYKKGNHLFIIMEDGRSGKDRNIDSDANNLNTSNTEQLQEIINEFSINIFLPTSQTLTGAQAIDLCWSELLLYMFYCLHGVSFENKEDSNYLTSFLRHGSVLYTGAYYEHSYTFQYVYEINYKQSFGDRFIKTVPFEKINISFHEKEEGSNIILNEED